MNATDREAITALIYGYAESLDAGDFKGVARLFAHATLRTHGRAAERRGEGEVLALYQNTVALYDGTPGTKHVTTNLVIEIDADRVTAAARSYYTVFQARPELPLQAIIAGRYHDRFSRSGRGWHFSDRLIFVDLVGDLRFHLKRNLFDSSSGT